MVVTPSISQRRSGRRGFLLTVEMIVVLPVLMTILFAIVEFSLIAIARLKIANATNAAAAHLSLTSPDADGIQRSLRSCLGSKLANGAVARVVLPDEIGEIGYLHLTVPMTNVTPDLLAFAGFSTRDTEVSFSAAFVRGPRASATEFQESESSAGAEHLAPDERFRL